MLCPWARQFTLKCFTWLRWKWEPGRTYMVMCTISSMHRNSFRTVCSQWSWNGTRMKMSSDQGGGGARCKNSRIICFQIWYQIINLHLYIYLYFPSKLLLPIGYEGIWCSWAFEEFLCWEIGFAHTEILIDLLTANFIFIRLDGKINKINIFMMWCISSHTQKLKYWWNKYIIKSF